MQLVRLGVETSKDAIIPKDIDWMQLKALAEEQGISSIVLDGIEKLPDNQRPPQVLLLEWIGEVLQGESVYKLQKDVATDIAKLFYKNGIRTYILKGVVVSECYPKPNHRVSVDIDCFLLPDKGDFDAWSLGNDLIRSKRINVNTDFYKNSSFDISGVNIENHQYLTPFRGNARLASLEKLLQSYLGKDNGEDVFEGTHLYRPPVMVSALFLIEHAYSHFLHEGLTWRMVLDWIMFNKKHNKEINWVEFEGNIDKFGFRKFYDSYHRLGLYLIGEFQASGFRIQEKKMLDDIWAPLDLHESLHGVKAKFQLAGNYWRARWKYKYFTDMTWVRALYEWVTGALFDRHPSLE